VTAKADVRCIFCKLPATTSRSVEHILPEALGNKDHWLPAGVVCDSCNNYFARKVEGPLLSTSYFKHLRSRQLVENKRGIVPVVPALVPGARLVVDFRVGDLSIGARSLSDEQKLLDALLHGRARSLYCAHPDSVDARLMSRLLAKIAVELLALRLMGVDGWRAEIVDNPQLDALRRHARVGDRPDIWPFNSRRIYDEDATHHDGGMEYQMVHEFDLLYTEQQELFLVLCLFGEEFAINMGGPEIEGYRAWLTQNGDISPLYSRSSTR
jgi:hypothetical protein